MPTDAGRRSPLVGMAAARSLLLLLLVSVVSPSPWRTAFGASSADIADADRTVRVTVPTTAFDLLNGAHSIYQIQVPTLKMTIVTATAAAAASELFNGQTDIIIAHAASVLTPAQRALYPDILQFPLYAQQYAIAYTDDLYRTIGTTNLVLTVPLLARIYSANVTYWNDTAIQDVNPLVTLPFEPIQLVLGELYSTTGQDCLCGVFNRADPDFAERFPCTPERYEPPLAKYAVPPILAAVADLLPLTRVAKFALSFGGLVPTLSAGLNVADVTNILGNRIVPSLLSGTLAMWEVGFPLVDGAADLSRAHGPQTYPFSQYVYIMTSQSAVRLTCAQKRNVLDFLLFLFQSPTMVSLASALATPMLPVGLQDTVGLNSAPLTCVSGESIYQVASSQLGVIFGIEPFQALLARLFSLYTAFYPSSRQYSFVIGNEVETFSLINHDSVKSVLLPGESAIDAAITVSTTPDTENTIRHQSFVFATVSVALLYSLPNGLTKADVPHMVLDLETVSLIYTGAISNWTHPRIARLNPSLMAAFAAKPTVSTRLTVVLCCSASRGASSTVALMRAALLPTNAFRASVLSTTPALDWTKVWTSAYQRKVAFVNADADLHVGSVVSSTPGAIGYNRMNYQLADDTIHVRLLPWKGSDDASLTALALDQNLDAGGFYTKAYEVSVPPQPSSASDCVNFDHAEVDPVTSGGAFSIAGAYLDFTRPYVPAQCWPLTSAVQILVPTSYSNAAADDSRKCAQGKQTLEMIRWLVTAPALTGALAQEGFARISDSPPVRAYFTRTIDQVECDGQPLLTTLPSVWTLAAGVVTFANAYGGVWLAIVILAAGAVVYHRQSISIRSSGAQVLVIQSLGFVLLFVSAMLWSSATNGGSSAAGVDDSKCAQFWVWLNIGFTLAFFPLVLKLWKLGRMLARIHVSTRRRSASSSKVVKSKLTNRKLLILLVGALAIDVILLAVSHAGVGQGGFTLVLDIETSGTDVHHYLHCKPDTNAAAWIGVLLGYKAAWLFWGVLETFTARTGAASSMALAIKEAQQFAYALYNVAFSSCVIVPVILLLSILGDGLVILVCVLIVWVATVAWCVLFLPKVHHELNLRQERHKNLLLSESMLSGDGAASRTKGGAGGLTFTFIALNTMTREELTRYLLVFDRHIVDAKRRLNLLGGLHLLTGHVEYRAPLLVHDEGDVEQSISRRVSAVSRSHHPAGGAAAGAAVSGNGLSRRPSYSVRGLIPPQQHVRENSVRLSLTNNYTITSAVNSPGAKTRHLSTGVGGARVVPSSSPVLNATNSSGPVSPLMSPQQRHARIPSSPGAPPLHPLASPPTSSGGIMTIRSPSGTVGRRKIGQFSHRPHAASTGSAAPAAASSSSQMPPVVVTFHQFDPPPSADFSLGHGLVTDESEAAHFHMGSGSMQHGQQFLHAPADRSPSPPLGPEETHTGGLADGEDSTTVASLPDHLRLPSTDLLDVPESAAT